MTMQDLYAKFPVQTGAVGVLVAGLVGPLLAALCGATQTLTAGIFHNRRADYHAQDKIHEFALTLYCLTDVALASFLLHQLTHARNLHAAWIACATHQGAYLYAAATSFGWQKTMWPSFTVAGMASYMAVTTAKL